MKLVRYGRPAMEKPGILDADDTLRDLSGIVPDISGDTLSETTLARLASLNLATLPKVSGQPRLGVPVAGMDPIGDRIRALMPVTVSTVAVAIRISNHGDTIGCPASVGRGIDVMPVSPLVNDGK